MNKRPLCIVGIVLILCIWLCECLGIFHLKNPRPSPELSAILEVSSEHVVNGEIYAYEEQDSCVVYSLKNSYLVHSDQEIPLKKVKIYCDKSAVRYPMGMHVRVYGTLKKIETATNPGQFDARSYYAARKIYYQVWAESLCALSDTHSVLGEWGYHLRCRVQNSLNQITRPEIAGLLNAMICGDKGDMEEEWKLQFQVGGISHITAISGLHLSLLGMGVFYLLCYMWIPIPIAGVISGILLSVYCLWVGSSISAVRALIMFLVAIMGKLLGRTYDMLSALALAAIVTVLLCPASIFDCGFWLSYVAVLGLGVLVPAMEEKVLPHMLKGGMAIFLITCPITLHFFYEISPYGLLLNLLVLPTVGIVLVSGLAGGVLGMGIPILGKAAVLPGSLLLTLYEVCCESISKLPGSTWILGCPSSYAIAIYYFVLLGGWFIWKRKDFSLLWKRSVLAGVGIAFVLLFIWKPNQKTEIAFLDVGQGDCAVVNSSAGNTYVVDGGSSSEKNVGKYRVLPFLKYKGIRKVDFWMVSHTDEDHMNGVLEILKMSGQHQTSLCIEHLILPYWQQDEVQDELEEAALMAGCEIVYVEKGACIQEENLSWQCLHPGSADGIDYLEETNAGSQVWYLNADGMQILFTGDVEGKGEELLLYEWRKRNLESLDLLKVSHHGSRNSTSELFLKLVKPKAAVISCEANNLYGHPHAETVERLAAAGAEVFYTKDSGMIEVRIADGSAKELFINSKRGYNLIN